MKIKNKNLAPIATTIDKDVLAEFRLLVVKVHGQLHRFYKKELTIAIQDRINVLKNKIEEK
jgi:hypothetical protein